MNRIPTIALAASLLSTFMLPVQSAAAPEPRDKTDLAMKCWLGIGPGACWKDYGCNGGGGPLERVDYLGINAAGAGIYGVRYMHRNAAYVVSPDPDGKTDHYLVRGTDRYWIKRALSSREAPILIYTRPRNSPVTGCLWPAP